MSNLKPVELDTFDAINNHWKCSACYMDGTTDNGGDCVCINDCNTLRPVYNDEPKKQTIPTYIWVIMGVLGAAMLAIVIGLTAAAALQANNASTHPRSIIDQPGTSFALDNNWNIYRSVGPIAPSNWRTAGSAGLPASLNNLKIRGSFGPDFLESTSSYQDVYGLWPTYTWDPSVDQLFPARQTAVRIEIGWGTFTAKSGGATGVVKVRLITPKHWFTPATPTKAASPLIKANCVVGGMVISTEVSKSSANPYFTDKELKAHIWPNGTNNQYPFDSYISQMDFSCTYQIIDTNAVEKGFPATGKLAFWVAVDPFNTGIWQNRFQAKRPQIIPSVNVEQRCDIGVQNAQALATVSGGLKGEIVPQTAKLNPAGRLFFKIPLISVKTKYGSTQQFAGEIVPDLIMTGSQSSSSIVPNNCAAQQKDYADATGKYIGYKLSNMPSGCICAKYDTKPGSQPNYCETSPISFVYLFKDALGLAMGLPASPTTNPLDKTVIDVFFGEGQASRKLQEEEEEEEEERNDIGQRKRKMQDTPGGATVVAQIGQPTLVMTIAIEAYGDYDPTTGLGTIGYTTAQLRSLMDAAIGSGSVTKIVEQLTEYGDEIKAAFGSPVLGAPTASDIPWADNSGVFADYGNSATTSSCTPLPACQYVDVSKFATYFDKAFDITTYYTGKYLPANDDGNSNADQPVYTLPATDDGGSGGSFRKVRKLEDVFHEARSLVKTTVTQAKKFPWDHAGEEVPLLDTHSYDVKEGRRSLKGIPVPAKLLPSNLPTPAPAGPGCQPIIEFIRTEIPWMLQITTSRAPIHQVFAMFLMCAMWMIVLGQLLAFLPYYLRIQKVNSAGMASGQAPLIFALTGIRRAMPQSPEIGAIFDFASYYWCLIIVTFNMIFMGVNWNLFALNRPAREKAYAANEKDAKLLANKGFAKLSNEEVVNLFINTKRADWVPALQANKTTGKALKYVTKIEEMAEIVPGGPDWKAKGLPKFELIADIKSWAADGVDRAKILPPAGGIPIASPGLLPPPVKAQPGDKIPAPGVPLSPLGSPPAAAKAAAAPKKK